MNEAPRIVLKQERDLSQIVEAAFGLYVQNLQPFLTIAAVVVPLVFAGTVFQATIDNVGVRAAVSVVLWLSQAAVSLLVAAALIAAISDVGAGREAEFSQAYDVAFQRFWTLVGAVLRSIFHVVLFFITIIGIPWGIQRAVRWMFIEQAVILDGTSAKAALAYSADAVEGSWWRTFGISLVLGIITGVPVSIITALFSLAPIVIAAGVNAAVQAAVLPFGVAAATLLYLDLKTRRDAAAAGP